MEKLFESRKLLELGKQNAEAYQSGSPFPHIVLDNVFNPELLDRAVESFPSTEDIEWFKYDNPLEKKLAMNWLDRLPEVFTGILLQLNSYSFIQFLEELTGIKNLIPDPTFNGGGLHQIPKGGKLDIHADYNFHPKYKLDRRLNALIYLNKNWKEEFGGHFELWDKEMTEAKKRVLPVFNRLAIFSTSDWSYHGHPDPLSCPEGWTRKSIALYYYTNGRPEEEASTAHSTVFKKRPFDPDSPELDALREKRSKGRVANLTSKQQ